MPMHIRPTNIRVAAAVCAVLAMLTGCRERAVDARNAPVIIISIDTLRADHLPA